ncbi:MAG: LysR family transcriptional regulator [Myxococcaceae bacterium]
MRNTGERPRTIAPDRLARIDLNHLRTFVTVARAGSFSAASRTLRVRQPAISKAIAGFERETGVAVFARGPRGVVLTAEGTQLLLLAEPLLAGLRATLDDFSQRDEALGGDLVFAAQEHVATRLLPAPLATLRREHPALFPRVVTGASHLLLRELVEGRVEFGLFFYLEPSSLIDRQKLGQVPARIVVNPAHARNATVLESFIGSREVDDLATRHYPTVRELQKARPKTRITLSSSSLELHRQLVLEGVGISILPEIVVADLLAAGKLVVHRPDWVFDVPLELVTRRGHRLSSAAHALLRSLRQRLVSSGYGPR